MARRRTQRENCERVSYELVAADLSREQVDDLARLTAEAEQVARTMPPGYAALLTEFARILSQTLRNVDYERTLEELLAGLPWPVEDE